MDRVSFGSGGRSRMQSVHSRVRVVDALKPLADCLYLIAVFSLDTIRTILLGRSRFL